MAETSTFRPFGTVLRQESPARLMQQQAMTADLGRQIAHILLTTPSGETVLSKIATAVGEAFEVDCCLVAVHQKEPEMEHRSYWYPSNGKGVLSEEEVSSLEHLVIGSMSAESDVLEISDTQAAVWGHSRFESGQLLPGRAVLGITTRFQGQVNGEIIIIRLQPYRWTALEMEQLKAVSDFAAIAISQTLQSGAIASYQQQVRSLAGHQTLVHELTMAIHHLAGLEQILQQAIDSLVDTLFVELGTILLLKYADPLYKNRSLGTGGRAPVGGDAQSEPHKPIIPVAKVTVANQGTGTGIGSAVGGPPAVAISGHKTTSTSLHQSFWLSDCAWCSEVFTTAPKPVAIADARELLTSHTAVKIASIFNPDEMPAVLLVPLVGATGSSTGQGTILGFLVLQHSSSRSWLPEELKLVELVAAQLSSAILQTQTIQQVQALVEERNSQLQRSLEVQAKLYEKTRQQVDQLRRLNQLKDEFLSTLSHELNTPLASMKMAIQMLRQPGVPAARQAKYLDILEAEWSRESNLVKDLLKLQELESQSCSINMQMLDLKPLIRKLAASFQQKWADKGLTLEVDLPKRALKIQTDADSLERILVELLTNAGKYSDPGTKVRLRASHEVSENTNQVVLSLTNTGAGISPADLPHIFDKFHRGKGATQQAIAGTGLGLALVKCLVQQLNGTINVSTRPLGDGQACAGASEPCETCFTLHLNVFKTDRV